MNELLERIGLGNISEPLIWLGIGILIMALEIVAPGFIIFWFGIGGVITSFFIAIGAVSSTEGKFLVFFISSLAFLSLWHFYLKNLPFFKKSTGDDVKDPTLTNLLGKVIKEIKPNISGEVELYEPFHGLKKWKAESQELIKIDEEIVVIEAEGIRLIVKKN
ncbi:MAG TPA: hypothetical protein DHW82_03315 [Spirochaetia bacterium]|nr:MAG: hypothetical protein A2Y41_02970 [Spirochaetes bacterium GWB1_36_13]HCL56022.1 hypothetical protein [Spirochaetia bacterium]